MHFYTKNNSIDYNTLIKLNFNSPADEDIIFQTPNEEKCYLLEGMWGGVLTFSNLPFDDFIFLFFALLLEIPIVFISTNICLLTVTM